MIRLVLLATAVGIWKWYLLARLLMPRWKVLTMYGSDAILMAVLSILDSLLGLMSSW